MIVRFVFFIVAPFDDWFAGVIGLEGLSIGCDWHLARKKCRPW